MGKTLYIFIDESGNFDFSPKGTKFFVLTAISTTEPSFRREDFLGLKYQLLASGLTSDSFHATEDLQPVRDMVFAQLQKLENFAVDAVIAQKNKTHPSLRAPEVFYRQISQTLLRYIFERHKDADAVDSIVVVLGSIFTKVKHEYILKSLKQYFKKNIEKPFRIYFHPVCSDINCQLADYCGWAIYVRATRGESRPYAMIAPFVKSHFDIFGAGKIEYYENK